MSVQKISYLVFLMLIPGMAFAYHEIPDIQLRTNSWAGYICIAVFLLCYLPVIFEEKLHLRKSKPMILAASIIWTIIALWGNAYDVKPDLIESTFMSGTEEWTALGLFLLVAMTYINALEERNIFAFLQGFLEKHRFSYRQLFWITGVLSFFLSAIADNLTTALVMAAVITTVGRGQKQFILLSCINVVVAANAGGAFSPFGDITTLMLWQAKKIDFFGFFALFLPSLINALIPALIMAFFVPKGGPESTYENFKIKRGGIVICCLFLVTLCMAISAEQILHLPSFFGMMAGLSLLMFYSYYINTTAKCEDDKNFNIYRKIASVEWDTLFFFYGVMFAVGGLGFMGYLTLVSNTMYGDLGPATSNIIVGLVSALFDNIPIMFAVISVNPPMEHFQWLLITLTAGVGGSTLAVGSAAGIGVLGVARGYYTFLGHLKWTPVILLGYFASIGVHYLVN